MRYLRLLWVLFKANVAEELEYRANFGAALLQTAFAVLVPALTLGVFFRQVPAIGGWRAHEALVLLGVFVALTGLVDFLLRPNMTRLVQHIQQGTLDLILVKPVDSMVLVSCRHMSVLRLADVALGVALAVYGLVLGGRAPSAGQVAAALVLFAAGFAIVYSLWLGIMTAAFWFVKVDNLHVIFTGLYETARYPVDAYRQPLRWALTYVFPVAFMTTVPARAALGRLDLSTALAAGALAAGCLVACRWLWRRALRHYSSAGG